MLTLDEVKEYLRIDHDAEDTYIESLIKTAAEMCENFTRLDLPDPMPESYKQAMLIIIGYYFEHRDGSNGGVSKIFYQLLQPYRKAAF